MELRGVLRLLLVVVCVSVLVHAKPYHKQKGVPRVKVFREELAVPASVPLSYRGNIPNGARWMAWDPQEPKEEEKKEEVEEEPVNIEPKEEVEPKQEVNMVQEEEQTTDDSCKNIYCHYGRVCDKGECVCAGEDYCVGHKKNVCGTDGNTYDSHCELHRMACVKGVHIGIDHSGKLCEILAKEIHKRVEHVVKEEPTEKNGRHGKDTQTDRKGKDEEEPKQEVEEKQESYDEYSDRDDYKTLSYKDDYMDVKDILDPEAEMPCTDLEYDRFKGNLVQYHCARIGEEDCGPKSQRKQFVANIMFNYYDRNNNELLDDMELEAIEHRDHLEKLSLYCGLTDMLNYDDENEDGSISLTEFYRALRIPTVILDENLKMFTTQVSTGNSIELKCDIKGAVEIIWKRNGAVLDDDTMGGELKTFDDGSLYISNLGLHHMGNYTCQDQFNEDVIQTHVLQVQLPPKVRVSPSTQFHTTGATVMLKCHADGVPVPEISWEMNEAPLPNDPEGSHYARLHNNATLEIRKAVYTKDTGAYKCKARNVAGVGQDVATVFIENSKVPKYSSGNDLYEVFVVFHDKGYTIYEPMRCHIEHQVSSSFNMFKVLPEYGETLSTLCASDEPCSWGSAVNVRNKYIYITQPKLNRVIVIEIQDRSNPVEVIPTDKVPVSIHYIEHLDQVWVLCWNEEVDGGAKTSVVVRQASDDIQHRTVHTQPVGNHFDMIKDLFLPNNNDLKHKFEHGYAVHHDQTGLQKIDLQTMQYIKTIDLKDENCIPVSVAFIPLGGQIWVHCSAPAGKPPRSSQLVLDYITDKVLAHHDLNGDPYVSPDSRFMVVVNDQTNSLTVYKIHDNGKQEELYNEYTNLHISDITFFPSERGRSYDFYASSANKNDVLYMNLASGKVEMIEGVGQAIKPDDWPWSRRNRVIVGGGVFGEYLMSPSQDSVVVIDGKRRHVQCEWQDISHGNVIVWVEPLHL